jgi:indole-3-glycerol phosphate synthase
VKNVLDEIVTVKRSEIAQARARVPLDDVRSAVRDAPPVRDFVAALRRQPGIGLIAEVKKASPSAGLIRADFDPVTIAATYAQAGAACLSVLTDEHYFQGHLDYLREVRAAVSLPVMRKEFVLDRYQVFEARAAGADCVLLIAECLDDAELQDLYGCIRELGMHALVELYEPGNLDRVLALEPPLVGINNRNLQTFQTDLAHTITLRSRVPEDVLLVSESGIRSRGDVERLLAAGVQAILVGETLMRADDMAAKTRELLGT